jgi:hypothetical protein
MLARFTGPPRGKKMRPWPLAHGGRVSTPYRFNLYAPAKEETRGRKEQTRDKARTLARPKGFAWSLVASLGRCVFGLGSSVGAPSPADPLIR